MIKREKTNCRRIGRVRTRTGFGKCFGGDLTLSELMWPPCLGLSEWPPRQREGLWEVTYVIELATNRD